MAGWLADRAESAGMRVERFESSPGKVNVVASAGPRGPGGLGLSGHMDVVPVAGQAWTTDPFRLTVREDRVLGRGTCDMKGFIAACVEAVASVPLQDLARELVLVWTHDEEVGCRGPLSLSIVLRRADAPSCSWWASPPTRIAHLHPGHATVRIATDVLHTAPAPAWGSARLLAGSGLEVPETSSVLRKVTGHPITPRPPSPS